MRKRASERELKRERANEREGGWERGSTRDWERTGEREGQYGERGEQRAPSTSAPDSSLVRWWSLHQASGATHPWSAEPHWQPQTSLQHMLKVNETRQYMRYWRGDWNCGGGQAGGSLQVWCVACSSAVNICSKQWGWDISRKQLQQAVGMGHFRNEFVFNTLREV
jgi:hypothetical protein